MPRLIGLGVLLLIHMGSYAQTPGRIVSTAPSITEALVALGAEHQVVGVTSYCLHLPAVRGKVVVGDFATPSVETVLQLRPDLVVVLDDRGELIRRFQSFGLPVLALPQQTLDQVLESLEVLGRRIGRSARARELRVEIGRGLADLRESVRSRRRPRTLFLVGRNSGALSDLYAAGDTSYLGQLLEIAGAENVAADAGGAYPKLSLEEVLKRDPEVILDLSHGEAGPYPQVERQSRELWSRFPGLSAVRQGRVHVLDNDVYLIPGPRMVDAVAELVRILHGDLE